MRERKHSPALTWPELLLSVPSTCSGAFRPHGYFQSCFAVSPLLELQQRETSRVVSPSALQGATFTDDTCGDTLPGWLSSHSLQTLRKPSRPATATHNYESLSAKYLLYRGACDPSQQSQEYHTYRIIWEFCDLCQAHNSGCLGQQQAHCQVDSQHPHLGTSQISFACGHQED